MANPVYHVTFTKNVADIQKRGLDPLSQSLWEKAETGERYQQDPSVYGFSDPKEALNWATKMAWEFEASPSDISILTLEGGDHWQKDPSGDLNLGQSAQQSLRLVEPSEVLDVFSLPEPVGTNAEFQEAVPGGDFEDWKDFYSKRLGSRPPDQSNLPSRITNPGFKFDPSAALVRDADSPDTIRALVSDDKNFAFETLRELKANETSAEATTQAELVSVRKQIYEATQQALSGSPDVITVYRTGPLRGGEPLSFTLDPNFSSDLNLPWAKRLKDPSLRAYTVNKADVLAAPNAVLRSGKGTGNEQELIIAGDKVRSDQSNLPAAIGAAAEASRLALPPDDEPRPKGKAFGSGIGSLMRRRMFPLIQAVQQGYEHLLTEEQKNDLREFLAQPTHEFFGFEKSGLESLKEKLGISNQEPPGLPMDLSSRLSRMREMGFDLDAYHGTTEGDPAAWDPENTVRESFLGSDRGYSSWPSDIGDWFTEDPYVASSGFAEGEGGHVIPVKLRLKNPAVYPTYEDLESALAEFPDTEEFREHLQKKGHDGILIEDSFTDVPVSREDYVVFDNKNIRSRFARFDPADSESGDISKAHGGFVVKPLYDS